MTEVLGGAGGYSASAPDGEFWYEPDGGEEEEEDLETTPTSWKDENKSKLQNIISRRRTLAEGALNADVVKEAGERGLPRREKSRSMRKSRSHGDEPIGDNQPLRRPKTSTSPNRGVKGQRRDSVSPTTGARRRRDSSSSPAPHKGEPRRRRADSSSSPQPTTARRRRESSGSPAPRRSRERSPKEQSASRNSGSPTRHHEGKSARAPKPKGSSSKTRKAPIRRVKSMDDPVFFDEDLDGSMEFNVQEQSPVARNTTRRHQHGSTSRLNSSAPRLTRGSSPQSRELEHIKARRQHMTKRKNSVQSLRRLMEQEQAQVKTAVGGGTVDEISIDDTVEIDDDDGDKQTNKSKSRRAHRTTGATSMREERTTGTAAVWKREARKNSRSPSNRNLLRKSYSDDDKLVGKGSEERRNATRRGHRITGASRRDERTTGTSLSRRDERTTAASRREERTTGSKRDQLRKSHSDKPNRPAGSRRRMSVGALESNNYKSKSFNQKSTKAQGRQHQQKARKEIAKGNRDDYGDDDYEITLDDLKVGEKSIRKSRSHGDDSYNRNNNSNNSHSNSRTKLGIGNLANIRVTKSDNSGSKTGSCFHASWGGDVMDVILISEDNHDAIPSKPGKQHK